MSWRLLLVVAVCVFVFVAWIEGIRARMERGQRAKDWGLISPRLTEPCDGGSVQNESAEA